MIILKRFANKRPLLFALFTILGWFVIAAIAVALASVLLGRPYFEYVPQSVGALTATAFVILMTWRMGWLRASGIAATGSWQAWLIALGLFIYFIFVLWPAFFGRIPSELVEIPSSGVDQSLFWRQLLVGVTEEILFRGIVLYILVRVWGRTRRGIVASVAVSAALFGIFHMLQVIAGRSASMALMASLESFASGLWWGAYAIHWRTIWPVAAIHAGSNIAVLVALEVVPTGLELSMTGYSLAILLQVPLITLGYWWLTKEGAYPVVPEPA